MYKLKKTLRVFVLTFSVVLMLCLLSGTASAVMSADNADNRLGVYSDWVESISDGQIYLKCPDKNIDEAYYTDMLNELFDSFKGEIGSDYCEITVFIEYSADSYPDTDTFREKMFETERHLNICWPEWSGRDGVNFCVGAYVYGDGTIAKYYVEAELKINGQSPEGAYADYNTQLKQIVSQAQSSCYTDEALVKYYCDWIKNNITYDINEATTNSACEALLKKRAVCGGFANLLRDLCNESGIPAIVPSSKSLNHAWNEVFIDGIWYTIDLLNVVRPISGGYENTYFFTDPNGSCDYPEETDEMKNQLFVFTFGCGESLLWKLNTGHDRLTITGNGAMPDYDWGEVFPEWIDYLGFSEVYISHGVSSVGAYAFWDVFGVGGLTTVYLPSTIEYIGEGAFSDCCDLQEIIFDGTKEQWDKIEKASDFEDVASTVIIKTKENAHTHSYGSWTVSVQPTCTSDGLKYKVCSGCGDMVEEAIISDGHSYTHTVTPPTCTQMGYTTHTCNVCQDSYVDSYVAENGHSMDIWKTLSEATCTKEGLKKRECLNCSYFESEAIGVTEHPFSNEWTVDVKPDCENAGSKSRHCTKCDARTDVTKMQPTGHSHVPTVTLPDCNNGGYTTYTCHCGDTYIGNITPALGHSFGDWYEVASPDCENNGTEVRKCSVCELEETKKTDALGHTYSTEWTVDTEVTCTKDGSKSHHCVRCGDKKDVTVIKAEGHKHSAVVTPVTCTENGYTTYTCHCGDTYISDYVYSKGHTKVTDIRVEPTCTSTGLTEGEHCSVCGKVFVAQTVIGKLEHTYTETLVPPTCTEDGLKTYTCSCGDTYTETVGASGHSYETEFTTDEAATCTKEGSKSRHCKNCSSVTDVTVIPVKPHSIKTTVFEPDCTHSGYTLNECDNCDFEEITDEKDAKGHSLGEAYTLEQATCNKEGTKRADCIRCGYYEVYIIEKTSHIYTEALVPPTCTEDGLKTYTCSCGDTYTETVGALGHSYETEFTTDEAATCTKEGSKSRHCKNCSSVTDVTVIPVKPHSIKTTVFEPDCTHSGYTLNECENCDFEETVNITKAKGHTEVTDTGIPATCQTDGLTDGSHCTVCGFVIEEQRFIPATEQTDSDSDAFCDQCGTAVQTEECDCLCHKDGIFEFFYKIIRFFWKLFGTNRACACGRIHY